MRKTVAVDVDGVLADYRDGWKGLDHIGDPIPGAVEFTKQLAEFADVLIYTSRCRANPDGSKEIGYIGSDDRRPADGLKEFVKAWLDKHGFAYHGIWTGQGKPNFAAIIDDRAVCCRPQSPFVGMLEPEDPDEFTQALWAAKNLCGE